MSTSSSESKDGAPISNETEIPPFRMPSMEEIRAQEVWDNCAVRSVASGVMGGGLGIAFGLFAGALDNPIMQDTMTGKEQFIYTAKQMGQRSWSHCKTFAVMGLIFSAAECTVEKARGKHDMTNTVVAGCVTGGTLAVKGGVKATCLGCAGFAAFSVLIEKFLGHT
ncbi:Mitochondrial import inner membrane translocase subunit TIM22-1 [Euphorbia peplus]|nr:Mitochondrial import inner membrane translocase subunit TIM22-1 [Euphorbia peplus]